MIVGSWVDAENQHDHSHGVYSGGPQPPNKPIGPPVGSGTPIVVEGAADGAVDAMRTPTESRRSGCTAPSNRTNASRRQEGFSGSRSTVRAARLLPPRS